MEKIKQQYFIFLGCFLVLQLAVQFILPYPLGLGVAIGIMVIVPFISRKIFLNKIGGSVFGSFGNTKMKMVCITCNLTTNKRECPRCGGKAFKTQ